MMTLSNFMKESPLRKLGGFGARYLYDDYLGTVVSAVTEERIIALTFDDGPTEATPKVLDILDSYGVKATFFQLGQHVRANPHIAREVAARGHAIGNHTFSHPHLSKLSPLQVRQELHQCQQALHEATGLSPVIMRPPYGSQRPNTALTARMMGHVTVHWSVAGDDWQGDDAEVIAERVLDQCQPGSIIVLHDGWLPNEDMPWSTEQQNAFADRTPTLESLSIIIEALQGQGYRFVTIPEMLATRSVMKTRWFW